jgi:hypothetical protein
MRFSTSGNVDDRLCDVEDRIQMLKAAVDQVVDELHTARPPLAPCADWPRRSRS